jgi:hypothetical protein
LVSAKYGTSAARRAGSLNSLRSGTWDQEEPRHATLRAKFKTTRRRRRRRRRIRRNTREGRGGEACA